MDTSTGGRLKRVKDYLDHEDFCFTYGDGVSDVNISKLVEFHQEQGLMATITAVQPPGRFGSVNLKADRVSCFEEKAQGDGAWINGGFFVLSPQVFDYIAGDRTSWEREPLEKLTEEIKK